MLCGVGADPWLCWPSWGTQYGFLEVFISRRKCQKMTRCWDTVMIWKHLWFWFSCYATDNFKSSRAKRFPQSQWLLGKLTKGNISSMNRFQVTGRIHFRTQEEAFPLISGNVIAGCKWKKNVASFAQKVLSAFLTEFVSASVFSPLNLGCIGRLAGEYFPHCVKVKSK